MNNSTVNFVPDESTNSTTHSSRLTAHDYVEISMFSINFLIGFPTHSYILWLIVTGTSGFALDFFNLNLCVCEFGICLESLICVLSLWFYSLSTFDFFLVGFVHTGRALFQCLICVERYLAVVHPVTFLKYKPLRYRVICCAAAWIITLGSCVSCMFYLDSKAYMYTCFLTLQMVLILLLQLFCLVAVLRALKQSGPGERKREENHMKRRALQIILITSVNTVFMYLPTTITAFCEILIEDTTDTNMFTAFTFFILTGYVHPVLYLHRTGKLSCSCLS